MILVHNTVSPLPEWQQQTCRTCLIVRRTVATVFSCCSFFKFILCHVLLSGSISVITNDGKHIVVSHCLPLISWATLSACFSVCICCGMGCYCYFCWWQGTLKGFDQATNIVLENCHERVYSTVAGVEQIVLGLYIIRGDNMYALTARLGSCFLLLSGSAQTALMLRCLCFVSRSLRICAHCIAVCVCF